MENLTGNWTGTIDGTNTGRVSADILHGEDNRLTGTLTHNDPQYGVYSFALVGQAAKTGSKVLLGLKPTTTPPPGVSLGNVSVGAELCGTGLIRGKWHTTAGTHGHFELRRSPIKTGPSAEGSVFIVHGHDEALKQRVARVLGAAKLQAVILHEQPDLNQTIIEKFEKHAGEACFAIVLMTPDDVGAAKSEAANLRPRARQNVILELGFFLGKLGRGRVFCLYSQGVEMPSDLFGVIYTPADAAGAWETKLVRELRAAGVSADLEAWLNSR